MVRLTWHGKEIYENGPIVFRPGDSLLFDSRDDIPAELLMNHAFRVTEVDSEEDPAGGAADERARGTMPRFTEVSMPDPDTD